MKDIKKIAAELANKINTASEEEIDSLIQDVAKENEINVNTLYRAARNAYYEKYERTSNKVSAEAAAGCNVR